MSEAFQMTFKILNNSDDFLQHLKEELMDAILYIQTAQEELKDVLDEISED